MPEYSYEIGVTQAGMVNLESLTVPVRPPRFSFAPYSKPIPLGDGSVRGAGWPKAEWRWDTITAAERDQLRVYCPGASAVVYIKTRVNANNGAQVDQYKTFKAVMVWPNPEGERDFKGIRKDLAIAFQALVEVA